MDHMFSAKPRETQISMQYRVDIDTMVPVAFDRIIFDILE